MISTTLNGLASNLSTVGRGRKQLLSIATDFCLVVLALWLAFSLRHGQPFSDFRATWYLFLSLPVATVAAFGALGVYHWRVRDAAPQLFLQIVKGCAVSALLLIVITYLAPPDRMMPRSLFAIYAMLLLIGAIAMRTAWRGLFPQSGRGEPVAIFGTGEEALDLANRLAQGDELAPRAFLDERSRRGRRGTLNGLPVIDARHSDNLERLSRRHEVTKIVLAVPQLSQTSYVEKVKSLTEAGFEVVTMPTAAEIEQDRSAMAELRAPSMRDVLGRREVPPDPGLIGLRVRGRSVLVTGGGGSIGSELCRQIVRLAPRRLVVLDACEYFVHRLEQEFADSVEGVEIAIRLGTVTDGAAVAELLREHEIETVFHAAAYKHVPIIESQPEQGVLVNVFGTMAVLDAAIAAGVGHFVLISTDKAVRPANAMGRTKRLAELVLQARAAAAPDTTISMVRFGNVLGSSGSVVPKFLEQIRAGGPVTVTSFSVERYFMTIREAAQLVLQASAIARGGDVFLLDMGERVRIVDLAEMLVRQCGKRLRSETGEAEDIEIVETRLRPGEKEIEEMFIRPTDERTVVSKVLTARENWLDWEDLEPILDELRALCRAHRSERLGERLAQIVEEIDGDADAEAGTAAALAAESAAESAVESAVESGAGAGPSVRPPPAEAARSRDRKARSGVDDPSPIGVP